MKRKLFLMLFFFSSLLANSDIGVTYDLSGGRFGDNLIAYAHAKWVSYQKKIPLIYKPFKYSSDLVLDEEEQKISSLSGIDFYTHYLDKGALSFDIELPVLYVCPFFPEDPWEYEKTEPTSWFSMDVDWNDPEFKKLLRSMIAPKQRLALIYPPKNQISVALHVRKGDGFDNKFDLKQGCVTNPMKFPPLSFYADALKEVVGCTGNKPIYCYVFTDAKHPEKIVKKLRSCLPKKCKIHFDFRQTNNHHNANVLEDFFSLMNFDILIRSHSHFSKMASFICDFAIVYSPKSYLICGNRVQITELSSDKHPELFHW